MKRRTPSKKCFAGNEPVFNWRSRAFGLAAIVMILVTSVLYWFSRSQEAVPRNTERTSPQDSHKADTSPVPPIMSTDSDPVLSTVTSQSMQNNRKQLLDPQSDGWQTEAIADDVSGMLKNVEELLRRSRPIDSASLAGIAAETVSVGPLRAKQLAVVFRDNSIVVRRGLSNDSKLATTGLEGLVRALQELCDFYAGATDIRVKFKVVGVDALSENVAATRIFFEARARRSPGADQEIASTLQQSAVWNVQWERHTDGNGLRIRSIEASEYQEVEARGKTGTWFADCTESVLGNTRCYREQLRFGADYWMRRLESHLSPRLLEGQIGFSIGDADGDE